MTEGRDGSGYICYGNSCLKDEDFYNAAYNQVWALALTWWGFIKKAMNIFGAAVVFGLLQECNFYRLPTLTNNF